MENDPVATALGTDLVTASQARAPGETERFVLDLAGRETDDVILLVAFDRLALLV